MHGGYELLEKPDGEVELDHIYLPTELSVEPYYEKPGLDLRIAFAQTLSETIMDSQIILIYGLGFSALDAELLNVVSHPEQYGSLKEIYVYDINPEPVVNRLKLLIPGSERLQFKTDTPCGYCDRGHFQFEPV